LYLLPFVTLGAAILMITRVRYPHIFNQLFKGKKPFYNLIWGLMVVVLFFLNPQLMLMAAFLGFAVSGLIRYCYFRVKHKKSEEQLTEISDSAGE
jgi:CDP-diacylglycerol--serine O-phosphatidyltransferase